MPNWPALLHFGLAVMRYPPPVFWAMTLPELASATGLHAQAVEADRFPLRVHLHMLMQQFPDALS